MIGAVLLNHFYVAASISAKLCRPAHFTQKHRSIHAPGDYKREKAYSLFAKRIRLFGCYSVVLQCQHLLQMQTISLFLSGGVMTPKAIKVITKQLQPT